MENTKAISSQVLGLFDTIRSQAHEYSRAFEQFQKESLEISRMHSAMQVQIQDMEHRSSELAIQLQQNVSDALVNIQHKAASIEGLFNELESIHELKTSLELLYNSFEERSAELSFLVDSVRSLVQKQVDKEFLKYDKKNELAFDQLRSYNLSQDQRLWTLQDQQRRGFALLSSDIDTFKSKITETKSIVDETTKIVENMIQTAETQLEEKLVEVRASIDEQLTKSLKDLTTNITPEKQFEDEFNALYQREIALERQIETLEKKHTTLLWSTIAFAVVSIGLISGIVLGAFG
ncbi:MAG: hypothetical protein JST20_02675 [Bacteroidetes bacterium]|nr:hypothetical protein [Bacteroidota bacterium]